MNKYGSDLFKGAAQYYSKYRPMYPASLVRFLVDRCALSGGEQLLDLGCGTGQLTIRFSDWCHKIVGIDTEPEMIKEASRIHNELRFGNIEWFSGSLEYYRKNNDEKFKLVTIAKAFHWMDRAKVLEHLYDMVTVDGGVSIIDNYNPASKLTTWQITLNEVVKHWYGSERKAGNTIYDHPNESHEDILSNSSFHVEIHELPPYEITWTIETILGNLYSTSYGSKRFLGNKVEAFEHDLRSSLLAINNSGIFKEQVDLSVKLGIKELL
ncbi:class I SAM-dependent methyltransferase [Halobacillus shinanisalinarum]|uniref:Class I SAM-dependent methyltransferase n=1 Tax=Halobacillus shinanisalinarum TaxID=2932258 RepID=A0ABY4GZ53_9BACI|nr:class I SAM-dependent methyltransferase [Halobacillus shinanisalinarum]UOQ93477.1 class I SAM-dependent methyltransferase [Halobacillus shinanisalinarum]